MKTRKLLVIATLALSALLITTGVAVALGVGAVNQGDNSTAEGDFSTVSGGQNNNIPAEGDFATIGGGLENVASAEFATVGGGRSNEATGAGSTVGGGGSSDEGSPGNTATGEFATVGGGDGNLAGFDNSTVGGGRFNTARGVNATIAGGRSNTTEGGSATIGGGEDNVASGANSTIGGGNINSASGEFATISGGREHTADNFFATVSGGNENNATGFSATVSGGGPHNVASGDVSIIGGGAQNFAAGSLSTIGGGSFNNAEGDSSTVGGGNNNHASGSNSTIPGGAGNSAEGDFSFATGRQAKANHNGAFVWADSTDEDFASTGENQFLIRASGGVGINTNSPNQLLVVGDDLGEPLPGNRVTIGSTGTAGPEGRSGLNLGEDLDQRAFILWQNDENYLQLGVKNGSVQENDALVIKDRRVGVGTATPTERLHVNGNVRANQFLTPSSIQWKTNIQTIEGALEKVQGLWGVSYDWKADGKHNIGLIAEEVGKVIPEVVVYEENGEEATAVDYAGLVPVLIEAVKEQQQLLEEKDDRIAALQKGNHELEARITALEVSAGTEGKGVQAGLLPFSASVMWTLAGGLGLLLVTPGLALGYRRIKRYE